MKVKNMHATSPLLTMLEVDECEGNVVRVRWPELPRALLVSS